MATWEDVVVKAKELAGMASRKVCDVADLTKNKLKIVENERAVRDALEAIGRVVYEGRKSDTPIDEEIVAELISQIDDLYAANDQLRAEIDNTCGRQVCTCGAANPQGAAYCNTCGKAL